MYPGVSARDQVESIPICQCHNEPMRWQKRHTRMGGQWCCKTQARAYQLSSRHGITQEECEALWVAQDGQCAVCLTPLGEKFVIDHDHRCCPGTRSCEKCVRGLLCSGCNILLGCAKDNIFVLERAIDYTIAHSR